MSEPKSGGAAGGGEGPTFEEDPEEAYRLLFAKFEEARERGEVYSTRFAKAITELRQVKEENDQLNNLAGERSVLEGDLSILSGDMATVQGQSSPTKAQAFHGNGENVYLWILNLRKLQSVQKWTDVQTLDAALMALQGKAGDWRIFVTRTNPASIDTLAKFIVEFTEYFEGTTGATESVRWISNLAQKSSESGRDFFVRVGNSSYKSCQRAREAMLADADCTTPEGGFDYCANYYMNAFFVNGLKAAVRCIIESKFSHLQDQKALLKAVIEAEIAASNDRDRVSAIELEVAALRRQTSSQSSGSRPGQSSGGGKPSSSGGGGSSGSLGPSGGLSFRQKVAARKTWVNCHKCKQWGKHRANECRLSAAKIEALTPQDGNRQPAGEPADAQYDSKN